MIFETKMSRIYAFYEVEFRAVSNSTNFEMKTKCRVALSLEEACWGYDPETLTPLATLIENETRRYISNEYGFMYVHFLFLKPKLLAVRDDIPQSV